MFLYSSKQEDMMKVTAERDWALPCTDAFEQHEDTNDPTCSTAIQSVSLLVSRAHAGRRKNSFRFTNVSLGVICSFHTAYFFGVKDKMLQFSAAEDPWKILFFLKNVKSKPGGCDA